jgi:hypothetical protein
MTIAGKEIKTSNSATVTLPVWLLTGSLSIFGSLIMVWGTFSAVKSKLELQAETNKTNIETLRKEKVDKEQFNLVYDKLVIIEKKIDQHIEGSKTN